MDSPLKYKDLKLDVNNIYDLDNLLVENNYESMALLKDLPPSNFPVVLINSRKHVKFLENAIKVYFIKLCEISSESLHEFSIIRSKLDKQLRKDYLEAKSIWLNDN
jgi:DNA-binding sugar fermentation-stimulating protein